MSTYYGHALVYEKHEDFTASVGRVAIGIKACLHRHKQTSGTESEWDNLYKDNPELIYLTIQKLTFYWAAFFFIL